jgi:hypothetical protein
MTKSYENKNYNAAHEKEFGWKIKQTNSKIGIVYIKKTKGILEGW